MNRRNFLKHFARGLGALAVSKPLVGALEEPVRRFWSMGVTASNPIRGNGWDFLHVDEIGIPPGMANEYMTALERQIVLDVMTDLKRYYMKTDPSAACLSQQSMVQLMSIPEDEKIISVDIHESVVDHTQLADVKTIPSHPEVWPLDPHAKTPLLLPKMHPSQDLMQKSDVSKLKFPG